MLRLAISVAMAATSTTKQWPDPSVCDCSIAGCATTCKSLDPNAFCGLAVSSGAQFTDGSGCACDWGLVYNKTASTAKSTTLCVKGGATPTPAPSGKCTQYTVQSNDTCASVAAKYNTTMDHISMGHGKACPGTLYPREKVVVCPRVLPDGCHYYNVAQGDTCYSIAAKEHVNTNDITTADGYACPWIIYPGQEVIICNNNGTMSASMAWLDADHDGED